MASQLHKISQVQSSFLLSFWQVWRNNKLHRLLFAADVAVKMHLFFSRLLYLLCIIIGIARLLLLVAAHNFFSFFNVRCGVLGEKRTRLTGVSRLTSVEPG